MPPPRGVIAFTRSLARELGSGDHGQRSGPGFIDTEMTSVLPDKLKAEILSRISLGRRLSRDVAGLFIPGYRGRLHNRAIIAVDAAW